MDHGYVFDATGVEGLVNHKVCKAALCCSTFEYKSKCKYVNDNVDFYVPNRPLALYRNFPPSQATVTTQPNFRQLNTIQPKQG